MISTLCFPFLLPPEMRPKAWISLRILPPCASSSLQLFVLRRISIIQTVLCCRVYTHSKYTEGCPAISPSAKLQRLRPDVSGGQVQPAINPQCGTKGWPREILIPHRCLMPRLHNKPHQVKPIFESSLLCWWDLGLQRFCQDSGSSFCDIKFTGHRSFSVVTGTNPRKGECRSLAIPSRSATCTPFIPSLPETPNNADCAERRFSHAIIVTNDSHHCEPTWTAPSHLRAAAPGAARLGESQPSRDYNSARTSA